MSRHSADRTHRAVPRWLTFPWLTVKHLQITTGALLIVLTGLIGAIALTGTTAPSPTVAIPAPPPRLPIDHSVGGLATVEPSLPSQTPEPPVVVEPQMAVPEPDPVPYVQPPRVVLVPVPTSQTPATVYRDVPVPVEVPTATQELQQPERTRDRNKPDDTPAQKPERDRGDRGREMCVGPVCFDDQRDRDDTNRTEDHGRTDGKRDERGDKP